MTVESLRKLKVKKGGAGKQEREENVRGEGNHEMYGKFPLGGSQWELKGLRENETLANRTTLYSAALSIVLGHASIPKRC